MSFDSQSQKTSTIYFTTEESVNPFSPSSPTGRLVLIYVKQISFVNHKFHENRITQTSASD